MCFCLVFPDAPESYPPLNRVSMGYYARSYRRLSKPTVLSHSGNVQRAECKETQCRYHAYTFNLSADAITAEHGRIDILHEVSNKDS